MKHRNLSLLHGAVSFVKVLIICVLLMGGGGKCYARNTVESDNGSINLRTSLPAWAVGVTNIAVDYNVAQRWSLSADLRFSAWNYFSETRKYRTFSFRPEARWWIKSGHEGFFSSVHLALIYYNVALPSWTYRIQDHSGHNPSVLPGVGCGFRKTVSRNGRWAVEGSIAVGVGRLNYDRFENRPNGRLVDTRHRFFFGVDDLSVSIVYSFNHSKQ